MIGRFAAVPLILCPYEWEGGKLEVAIILVIHLSLLFCFCLSMFNNCLPAVLVYWSQSYQLKKVCDNNFERCANSRKWSHTARWPNRSPSPFCVTCGVSRPFVSRPFTFYKRIGIAPDHWVVDGREYHKVIWTSSDVRKPWVVDGGCSQHNGALSLNLAETISVIIAFLAETSFQWS